MKVSVKDFSVDMELGNNGVELEIRSADGEKQLGDLYVAKKGLIWCNGKVPRKNGVAVSWDEFIEWMNS